MAPSCLVDTSRQRGKIHVNWVKKQLFRRCDLIEKTQRIGCYTLMVKNMPDKPNIVYILADDMGFGDLSCLNEKSKIKTLFLDQLAAEGMVFGDAHASSAVCTPGNPQENDGERIWKQLWWMAG